MSITATDAVARPPPLDHEIPIREPATGIQATPNPGTHSSPRLS
jgi:hypothetical protein